MNTKTMNTVKLTVKLIATSTAALFIATTNPISAAPVEEDVFENMPENARRALAAQIQALNEVFNNAAQEQAANGNGEPLDQAKEHTEKLRQAAAGETPEGRVDVKLIHVRDETIGELLVRYGKNVALTGAVAVCVIRLLDAMGLIPESLKGTGTTFTTPYPNPTFNTPAQSWWQKLLFGTPSTPTKK